MIDVPPDEPGWLTTARELRAIAQTGLAYCDDVFDRQRYERIRALAVDLLSHGAADPAHVPILLDLLRNEPGYATPKVAVRAAIIRDDTVLMVRERSDGLWTLPGGWADVNQTAAQCVVREVAEESGFEVRATKLAAVHDYRLRQPRRHLDSIYVLFFVCELLGGAARPSEETSEVAFFSRRTLPPLSLGRTTAAQIEMLFRHAHDPALPTEFD